MLFLLNGEGELQRLDNDRVFQGSNNATKLGVIYPYSGVTLAASFTLPNGMTTGYITMPPLSTYTLKNGGGDVVKTFDYLYYASIPIPNTVTALQGVCKVTVAQTAVSGTGAAGSIDPAQVDVNTGYSASFTVEYASLPEYTVPDNPTEEDFQELITLLNAYQALVSGGVTALQGRMETAESNIKDLQTRMTTAETDIDNAQADIADLLADVGTLQGDVAEKQDKTDSALKTDDKTVVGAINAIYDELTDTSGTGFASRLDTAEAEINVLDSRVEDVEEKTAMPLMTDFTVDVATSTATKFYNNGTQADVTLPTGDTAERINFLTSAVFTDEQWAEQSDGTYALTLPASQTGRTNNKYVANLEVTDGSMQVVSADKFLKNEDGSITLKDFSEPWSGRVITVAAGQHGSVIHFGTAVTGTGEQVSADLELRAAAMVGDAYINSNTGEVYKCTAVSTTTSTWEFQGSFKGAPGKDGADGTDGADGAAATVTVGQVTTLPAGSQATVTNSGDENAAVLNFGIPQGATGTPGANGTDGQDGVGIQNIAADGQDENGGNIYRITLTNGQSHTFTAPKGAQGAQGATGATGAPGKDFRIYKTYASIAAMNADAGNVPDGEFVSIASNENDPDNGKVYQRSTDGETDFVFIFDLSGAQGIQGEAATIAIGQVLTGEPGTNASVENVGTANAAILNITIPRGNPGIDGTNGTDGAPGADGADGAAATIQIGEVVTGAAGTNASVENTGTENAAILKFTIPRGATGTPGADGQDGAPGADGKNGATFTPSVDTNGNLSWTNDGGLTNPETVNVRGAQGEAATVQVGTTTTLPAGSQATVNNSGTSEEAVLNFGIPTGQPGADGQAATIEVGEVTTGAAGSQASVTNSGTENAAVLDFTIPQGADGASGVTDVMAGTPTEQDGYTVTPVTFNFEQGNSKTVEVKAKNGEGAGVQQNAIINRTANVDTADENSPDFVENNGDLWVKMRASISIESITGVLNPTRGGASAATASNGKIYVFGGQHQEQLAGGSFTGYNLNDIVEFDPVAQSVTTLEATLPSARFDTSAATAPNGKIYVFGGRTDAGTTSNIIEFDPVEKSVTTLDTPLPTAIQSTSAAAAPNGKIYVFGGRSGDGLGTNNIIEFDPVAYTATRISTRLPDLSSQTGAATSSNGKIYVFGVGTDHICEFDPETKSVSIIGDMPSTNAAYAAATSSNGKIYVLSSRSGDPVMEFDPSTNALSLSKVYPDIYPSGVAAAGTNIYMFGGSVNTITIDTITEIRTPSTPYVYRKIITADASGAITASGAVSAPSFNATT